MVTTFLAALAALVALYHVYVFCVKYTYWKKRGVPHTPPTSIVGNFGAMLRRNKYFATVVKDLTEPFREHGYCGVYQWAKPILVVWEPDLIKQVLCKDFSSFHDRGLPADENDPLSQHLFNLNGTKWKNMRNKLSPTFTSGKLKLMVPLISDIGKEMSDVVTAKAASSDTHEVDMSDVLTRFATDVIGSVAFGIQCNSLKNKDEEFLQMSRQIFKFTPLQLLRGILEGLHPAFAKLLPMKWVFSHMHHFFINLMKETVEYREKNDIQRNDFVQLMMALRKADLASMDPENHMELTPGVMAAQGFIFFIAGLDNISSTVAFCLNRMVADPDLQDRVADEVIGTLHQNGGELTYEALKKMELLNGVAMEGLRLWAPLGLLLRKCNEPTQVGDLLVEKGTAVFIATDVVHSDEKYFPDPQRFDPGRHSGVAKETRHPYSFLPFGEGPRICIAERFAILEMKLAIAVLVRDFVFTAGPKFESEIIMDYKSFFPRSLNGIHLQVSPRG